MCLIPLLPPVALPDRPMNLRTHLSRSNGYSELGMFDESIQASSMSFA
jgi:hypothetical protein